MDYSRVLLTVLVGVLLAHNIQLSRGCAPSCNARLGNDDGGGSGSGDDDLVLPTTFFKTIEIVTVSSAEEARVRGACHSICITAVRTRTEWLVVISYMCCHSYVVCKGRVYIYSIVDGCLLYRMM